MEAETLEENIHLSIVNEKAISRSHSGLNLTEEQNEEEKIVYDKQTIKTSIFLTVLYTLQGFPIGVIEAFTVSLQLKGASYKTLGLLSFAYWPFSLKLLWAPLVDSIYVKKFGRRKSWLVPVQILLGFAFLYLYNKIDYIMKNVHESSVMLEFTFILTSAMFLAATQDISVDGWALSLFSEQNVSLASTCNTVGQTFGYIVANLSFILLTSKSFCEKYLFFISKGDSLVSESTLFFYFGMIYISVTLFIAIFVPETTPALNANIKKTPEDKKTKTHNDSVKNAYKALWGYINLRPIRVLSFHLLVFKVGFAAIDAITYKKLIEVGMDKNIMALMSLPLVILQIILPILIDTYVNKHGAILVQLKVYKYRLFYAFISVSLFFTAKKLKGDFSSEDVIFPNWFYGITLLASLLYQVPSYMIYVSGMAFFAQISDPEFGGAQMTLLNTICNLGTKWPNSLVLFALDYFTDKDCISKSEKITLYSCKTKVAAEACHKQQGHTCSTTFDGFYRLSFYCFILGLLWYLLFKKSFSKLQNLPRSAWMLKTKTN